MNPPDDTHLDAELQASLVGGLEPRVVDIVDYTNEWPRRFEQEKKRLSEALGEVAHRIEHIGSTAVPGLGAKDVVDICVTVENAEEDQRYRSVVESLGYILHSTEPGHRCFRTAARDVNLHVYADDASEVTDYIALRERLRSSPDDRRLYEAVKRELAAQGEWRDVNYYADAKSTVIAEILERARRSDGGGSEE